MRAATAAAELAGNCTENGSGCECEYEALWCGCAFHMTDLLPQSNYQAEAQILRGWTAG